MSIKIPCNDCSNKKDCEEPLPSMQCESYEKGISDEEIIRLYHGTSKTMQKSIIEILKVTQGRPEM